ncbi:AsmA-like C-terminal domain-containing protein [Campylobacter sp. 2018MI35]|uniref:YhdP family protein n=1 Tax=Campylobacter sp. 2018MI34 TaxID=2800582 RepID=UPI0019058789|nr:AsmA-like C-terminal domain-containing protein [Campylobacter sp. 2018MI34]MBK1991664.1 AsmA-like C-terminal domain-containing protein [Campylobacter sp. 2018MI34]
MKKKILYFLLTISILVMLLFLVLKNGISISSVQFDFLKLEQLYIKLDKKLIVRAKNISIYQKSDINSQKQTNQFASVKLLSLAENLKYFYIFIQEIDIRNLVFKDYHLQILFKNNEFFINNNLFFLKTTLQKEKNNIKVNIEKMLIKDYNLSIVGNLDINTKSEFYFFDAKANSDLINFNINLSYKNGQLAYNFKEISFKNILEIFNKIQNKVQLPEDLILWVGNRVKGEFYYLDYIKGFIDFNKKRYYLDNIEASGYVDKVKISLDGKMDPIEIPKLNLSLNKQKLDFNFKKANYKQADLSASKIYIYDLMDENKAGIYLHIISNNLKLDQKLWKALDFYDVKIPFFQKEGKTKTDFTLDLGFYKDQSLFDGKFIIENSILNFLDTNVSRALLKINNNTLNIEEANITNKFLKADFNASIDLNTKIGQFNTKIDQFSVENNIFDIKNEDLIIDLDFTQNCKVFIPKWQLDLEISDNLTINLNNPSILALYSPLLKQLGFKNAQSVIYSGSDFDNFKIEINNASFQSNFLNGSNPYQNDSFYIEKKQNTIFINSKSDLISAILSDKNKEIHFKNLTYIYKEDKEKFFSLDSNTENIYFGGANFNIIFKDTNNTLSFDRLEANLNENTLNIKANKNDTNLNFDFSPNYINLNINNINDEFLNTFLQKQAVLQGVFDLNVTGRNFEDFEGQFKIKNTFIKDLKGTNQLISFIDTVPSLLLFKTPTFNEKGLSVIDGVVVFDRKKDLFRVKAISLNGESVDIFGVGNINLRLKNIDLNLELKTLKSASSVISKVPIINYVILGKNQEISTNIKVDGSLDNPNFHTQILGDVVKSPFNLIKNIIELPTNLFK